MGLFATFKRLLFITIEALIVAVVLVLFMPSVPPDAKYSTPFKVTPSLPLEGALALNERLNNAEIWHKNDFVGPEAFAEYNGELYTTVHGGDVVKLVGSHVVPVVKFGKPCEGLYEESVCGRPLGLVFDKNGALYVADAYYGVFQVDVKTGKKVQLVSVDEEIDGKKPKVPNSIAVANNGDMYWSDSSTEFYLEDGAFDILADGSGRLIHYDAITETNRVLIKDLHFANGVVLSDDEEFVLVSETVRSRIHRYYLKGAKKGTSDIFLDGLPGMPDNLKTDGHGGFFVPLVMSRDAEHPSAAQIFGPFPRVRKFISRLLGLIELIFKITHQIYPNIVSKQGMHMVGHFGPVAQMFKSHRVTVLRVSKTGEVLESLHALDKKISGISEAYIFKNHLYLGSPFNDYIARVPLDKAGLQHLTPQVSKKSAAKNKSSSTTQTPLKVTTPKPTTQVPPKVTTQAPPKVATQATPKVTTQAPPKAPTTAKPPPAVKQTPPTTKQTTALPTTKQVPPTTTQAPDSTKESPTKNIPPAKAQSGRNSASSENAKETPRSGQASKQTPSQPQQVKEPKTAPVKDSSKPPVKQ